ncbi:methionine--tRNA ligase [Candidatus Campbellbacteria bacterium RIFOXYC2_FULL_35_25]|uniref:Methionine--tRNA ligase n=1 Tax=Candidatus Campbellbacteria bacterium RIFOXYC2_FULL_35_25 TaxID=1797582 RepID=A0A1F5EIS1_9BACT|nr:MAG: methionine--tRNA ligase [Candidatus Campbellbacteria bacterium RIFOXYC2_FULL_35_25]
MKKFYITTTLPYTNAPLHIGHALEYVRADSLARYKRLQGHEVFFNTGSDEHGMKVYKKSLEEGKDTKEYTNGHVESFKEQIKELNISYTNFVRTTDEDHMKAAQEFWKVCEANGDIYKKNYKSKYCVGCELEKTDSELIKGECPDHLGQEIEVIEEENYFFRWSNYKDKLLELYKSNSSFVVPESRFNEIKAFVERGLNDFSISRLKEKMPWGVPVPGDENHVMYVWFDALTNYVSVVGWPNDMDTFRSWWPALQFAGKDNLRAQSAMWQAMLMSANLPPSKQIVIHGHITSNGQKMSKSIGNVSNPLDIVNEYGTDALRYYLTREVSSVEDGDYTQERFLESYNANLANGLGNLVSRVLKMSVSYGVTTSLLDNDTVLNNENNKEYRDSIDGYRLDNATDFIWKKIGALDSFVQDTQPFKTIKIDEEKAKKDVEYLLKGLWEISALLIPFMPQTAEKIQEAIRENKIPEALFMRK